MCRGLRSQNLCHQDETGAAGGREVPSDVSAPRLVSLGLGVRGGWGRVESLEYDVEGLGMVWEVGVCCGRLGHTWRLG